ncbi:hypothetical protein MU582_08330 [Nocardioidaceae bacterium SCSIO 66511]|nr:hypothetical protein MU582_08330 [Nocardioidaceae bacterium SCSIO 66511]
MPTDEKLGIGGQLLFVAFGGILGSPFLLLGSGLVVDVKRQIQRLRKELGRGDDEDRP